MNGQYAPLFLAVSIPTLVGLVALVLNRSDFNAVRKELTEVRERLANIDTRLGFIEGMLGVPAKTTTQKK